MYSAFVVDKQHFCSFDYQKAALIAKVIRTPAIKSMYPSKIGALLPIQAFFQLANKMLFTLNFESFWLLHVCLLLLNHYGEKQFSHKVAL